ncbi:response regulator receiver protein [Candidatus Magnetomorum sp. HK-1]|nr:response regulator receiver protein [Candidatus Magnetomorum sp. HK-1]
MQKYKVLIVEDDPDALQQLARTVRKEGFEVIEAGDGEQGLKKFESDLPDIVITDLKMPGISGMEVLHTIKRTSPHTQVIVITAFGKIDTAILAIREGAIDYIKKPIDLDLILLAIGRAKEKLDKYNKQPFFPTVLLAEDDQVARSSLVRVIEKEGWKVLAAADGEETIKLFRKNKVDIVLLDIKMPKKDGIQTLKELREITKDFESIILTGYGNELDAINAMRSGAINFLRKPIDLDQMLISIEKAIEKLSLDRSLKYRNREVELMEEIIAKLTGGNEIVLNINDDKQHTVWDFAQKLIDAIQIGLVVVDKNYNIRYLSSSLQLIAEDETSLTINETFAANLKRIGVEISYGELNNFLKRTFEMEYGSIEIFSAGKFSYITFTPMTMVFEKDIKETVTLMLIRGERK